MKYSQLWFCFMSLLIMCINQKVIVKKIRYSCNFDWFVSDGSGFLKRIWILPYETDPGGSTTFDARLLFLAVFRIHFIWIWYSYNFFDFYASLSLGIFFGYPAPDPRFLKWIRIRQNDTDPKYKILAPL